MCIENIPEYNGAGIYMLKGVNNNLIYIGSSVNIARRIQQHEFAIKNTGGGSIRMRSMIKPGYKFEAIILEKVSSQHTRYYLYDRENYYINKFNACGENGLNSIPVSGYKHSTISALRRDLECLISHIDELERRMSTTQHNGDYMEKLIFSTNKTIRISLEDMLQKMQFLNDIVEV